DVLGRHSPPARRARALDLRHEPRRLWKLRVGAEQRLGRGRRALDALAVARGDCVARAVEQVFDRIGLREVDGDRRRVPLGRRRHRQAARPGPARQRSKLRGARRLRRDPDERHGSLSDHGRAFFFAFGAAGFLPAPAASSSRMASMTASACPSTFTLLQIRASAPSGAMRNVDRRVPSISFPYIIFLPHAPYALCATRSGSLRSGNPILILSRNEPWLFTESFDTPTTAAPSLRRRGSAAVKSWASRVQPGVLSRG